MATSVQSKKKAKEGPPPKQWTVEVGKETIKLLDPDVRQLAAKTKLPAEQTHNLEALKNKTRAEILSAVVPPKLASQAFKSVSLEPHSFNKKAVGFVHSGNRRMELTIGNAKHQVHVKLKVEIEILGSQHLPPSNEEPDKHVRPKESKAGQGKGSKNSESAQANTAEARSNRASGSGATSTDDAASLLGSKAVAASSGASEDDASSGPAEEKEAQEKEAGASLSGSAKEKAAAASTTSTGPGLGRQASAGDGIIAPTGPSSPDPASAANSDADANANDRAESTAAQAVPNAVKRKAVSESEDSSGDDASPPSSKRPKS